MNDQCATNVESLRKARKQFLPRLKDVVTKKKDRSRPCLSKLCSAIIKIYQKKKIPLKCRDFSVLFKHIVVSIKLLFSVYAF